MSKIIRRMKTMTLAMIDFLLSSASFHRIGRSKGSLIIVTYHRILPRKFDQLSAVEPGMFVHDDTFRQHISVLSDEYELVKLSDWIQAKNEGSPLPKLACAITFDDGWADNFHYAFPILREFEVPATIFLVSDMVGTDVQFWPERLIRLLRHVGKERLASMHGESEHLDQLRSMADNVCFENGEFTPDELSEIIASAKQFSSEDLEGILSLAESKFGLPIQTATRDLLNWEQVNTMAASGLVEFGSHTRHHTRLLTGVVEQQLRDEICESKKIIERMLSTCVSLFCYPNGDHSEAAQEIVRQTYDGACGTANGWNDRHCDAYSLRRVSLHEARSDSVVKLRARLSGFI